MTPEERAARIAETKFELADLRLHLKALAANAQHIVTLWEASSATDWEARYMAEGIAEIEAAANHKAEGS